MPFRIAVLLSAVLLLSACDDLFTNSEDGVEVIGAVTVTRDVPTALYLVTSHRLTLRTPEDLDPADVFVRAGAGSTAEAALERRSDTQVDVVPSGTGDLVLELTDPDGEVLGTSRFEVRRIPDPMVRLGDSFGGTFVSQEFRDQVGLTLIQDGFPFDAKCDVDGFEMSYIQSRQDPISLQNDGARFSTLTLSVTERASPGDLYIFNFVRATCPGDTESRSINSMAFRIK